MHKDIFGKIFLIVITIFSVIFAIESFRNYKKSDLDYSEQKAKLIKENMDLKENLDNLQQSITQKAATLDNFEKDKKKFQDELVRLKKINENMAALYTRKLNKIKEENIELKKRISALESIPLVDQIKDIVKQETNENIKKILNNALEKIELIKSGKPVDLESSTVGIKNEMVKAPVLEEKSPAKESLPPQPKEFKEAKGLILSIDRKNNLFVINLGIKNDIKEGRHCRVFIGDKEVANAEIISVRYKLSAALIDDIKPGYKIGDIRENDKVLVELE
ncbi:MAG: hypothetical protein WC546_03330 [Candidatus Omnitrophota bacterium]